MYLHSYSNKSISVLSVDTLRGIRKPGFWTTTATKPLTIRLRQLASLAARGALVSHRAIFQCGIFQGTLVPDPPLLEERSASVRTNAQSVNACFAALFMRFEIRALTIAWSSSRGKG